ncbi:molybdopterin-binding protein, partial [Actinotalea sp. C106]|uniref:molybdopterin-binding protein n=1 Tax=Actinotalea sp. C106 TaxID=2908644 RepID=UPI0020291976
HDADAQALAAAIHDTGATAVRVGPVADDRAGLREVIADQLVRADLLVITGGLSAGPWDTVTDVLAPLGTVRFDHVAMAPGPRQGFGTVDDIPVFALPGHPVSAQVAYEVFVRPALRTMGGHTDIFRPSLRAASTRPWASPPGVRQFVPARVLGSPTDGYTVSPVGDPSQVALSSLAGANALAVVGEDTTQVRAGDALACLVLES